jgi:hypothetical protein
MDRYTHEEEMELFDSFPEELRLFFKDYPKWPDASFINEMLKKFGDPKIVIKKFKDVAKI